MKGTNNMADEFANAKVANPETSKTWDFEKDGAVLIGTLLGVKQHVGANDSNIYNVRMDDNETVGFWGSTVLDDKMAEVPVGSRLKVEFQGTKTNPKTNRNFKVFEVLYVEPAGTSAAAEATPEAAPTVPEPLAGGEPLDAATYDEIPFNDPSKV
jgi:hypothetical protein